MEEGNKKIAINELEKSSEVLESNTEMLQKKQLCVMIGTTQPKLIRPGMHFPSTFGQNFIFY